MAMTLRRRLIDWGLAALFLVLPALVLRASLRKPGETTAVDEAVLRVSAPLQAGVSWIVEKLGGLWGGYVALVDVEALEDVAMLKRAVPADTIGARVIAASLSPQFRVVRLRIDRGPGEVEEGMPVITSSGLVGRIQDVYGRHADVLLTTDPRSSVEVVVKRTGGLGILTGTGSPDRYACKIEWLERSTAPSADVTVKEGDEIFTSGLGGAFPAGLKVGTVRTVSTKEYGMFQEVEVAPVVSFSRLRAVLVLLAPPPPPDPGAGKKDRSKPAFDVRPY